MSSRLTRATNSSADSTFCAETLPAGLPQPVNAAHASIVEALAFSPDGKLLASGSFQEVALWDVRTGVLSQKMRTPSRGRGGRPGRPGKHTPAPSCAGTVHQLHAATLNKQNAYSRC